MVALTDTRRITKPTGRLTLQNLEIASETTVIRYLDWDCFDREARCWRDRKLSWQNETTFDSRLHFPSW